MSSIQIAYQAQHLEQGEASPKTHSITLKNFTGGEVPRSYLSSAATGQSANGTTILTGPSFKTKRVWALSVYLERGSNGAPDELRQLYDLFEDWDQDRSNGLAVAVGVNDNTFLEELQLSAVFSTPPTYTRLSPVLYVADFALTEV
jgi:hypothetical protein